jgi:hypothetical protein
MPNVIVSSCFLIIAINSKHAHFSALPPGAPATECISGRKAQASQRARRSIRDTQSLEVRRLPHYRELTITQAGRKLMTRTPIEAKLPVILVGLVGVSLLLALTGLSVQLAWIGKPLGAEGAEIGGISTGFFVASSLAAFIFAARNQGDVKSSGNPTGH